jgi:hypothetical protein
MKYLREHKKQMLRQAALFLRPGRGQGRAHGRVEGTAPTCRDRLPDSSAAC